ncbi:MAG: hypothetical protein CMJ59_25440 [Planctomycetaceae bacterium]|nr:hypothetical protein [Planctomycetaceae bacterium]
MEFSHIGLITQTPQTDEVFIPATRVWVTNFTKHPFRVEWLRFEEDSPVTGPVRTQPHVAFRVDSLDAAAAGLPVLLEPFEPLEGMRVGFFQSLDGAVIELMEYETDPFV